MTEKIILTSQPAAYSLIFRPGNTYTFDKSGRPIAFYIDGHYFGRGLNGRIKEKSWQGARDEFERFISEVPKEKAQSLYEKFWSDGREAKDKVHSTAAFEWRGQDERNPEEASAILDRLLSWDSDKIQNDEDNFNRLYQPINILPPDQYFTIPIQIAEGCPWNRCTFCGFYKDRSFRVRSLGEIEEHVRRVEEFLGKGVTLRQTVFLTDANALAVPQSTLIPVLDNLRKVFPAQAGSQGGICAFGDVPVINRKSLVELKDLREKGIRRIYVGVETGADEIRELIKKPGSQQDVVAAVGKLKEAGFEVGVIILLGVGGGEMAPLHLEETSNTLNVMDLRDGDIVYFSPFTPLPDTLYSQLEETRHLTSLETAQIRHQFQQFKSQLRAFSQNQGPKLSVYDIREFIL